MSIQNRSSAPGRGKARYKEHQDVAAESVRAAGRRPRGATTSAQSLISDMEICQAIAAANRRPLARDALGGEARQSVPARRIICREQEMLDRVPIVCSGWACAAVMLSDGSRQILSFLLAGDLVSTALLFGSKPTFFVESITPVEYRMFDRSELKQVVFREPSLIEKFCRMWMEEKARADELIVDLGRRTAEERIARLILGIEKRMAERGLIDGDPAGFEFPLRQHHIADATGLTPVHVSKVLNEFRRSGLLQLSERRLNIIDPAGFARIAEMR